MFVITSFACSLTTNLDELQNGVCPAQQKACDDKCVARDVPELGCGLDSCAPCTLPSVAIHVCGVGGTCGIAQCLPNFADCDGNPNNGCEVRTNFDVDNCNGCGQRCNLPNASPMCLSGSCTVSSCLPNFGDCDGKPANGCEVNLSTDAAHCSNCSAPCASGKRCVGSQCI